MRETTRNCLVGGFALTALSVLAVLMVWFGETPTWLQRGEWVLRIVGVRDIRGVGEGSPVHLSGVEIGRVSSLEFEDMDRPDQGVVITARIKNRYSVPRGSVGKIYGATLGIGTGEVNIIVPMLETSLLGKGSPGSIRGEMHSALKDIISDEFTNSVHRAVERIGDLATSATPVADNLAELISKRPIAEVDAPGATEKGVTANLSTTIQRVDALVANADKILGDPKLQADVKAAVSEIHAASDELHRLIGEVRGETKRTSNNLNEGIDRADESLRDLLIKAVEVTQKLDSVAGDFHSVSAQVASGKGTIGLLVHDARLYESVLLAADRLGDFLASLNRITSKIEQDGFITLAQKTPIGVIPKDFPIGLGSERSKGE